MDHWFALPADMKNTTFAFTQTITPFYQLRQRFRHNDGPPLLLWELMSLFRSKECTDPRYKVYSCLGLVTEWPKEPPLPPNYQLDTSEVFKRASLKVITDMGHLSLLTECDGNINSPKLPSWVPDYTRPEQGEAAQIGCHTRSILQCIRFK